MDLCTVRCREDLQRGEYALRALIDFGLAAAVQRPLLQFSEIALKEDLPPDSWSKF
jgi:hypothetical protein